MGGWLTKRARHPGTLDLGVLRLKFKRGSYYWISLNGSRILSGAKLFNAEELRPEFTDAMEQAGR